jgi:hypothetical protein
LQGAGFYFAQAHRPLQMADHFALHSDRLTVPSAITFWP